MNRLWIATNMPRYGGARPTRGSSPLATIASRANSERVGWAWSIPPTTLSWNAKSRSRLWATAFSWTRLPVICCLHEARAASSLNHPNICTIHQVGDSDGEAYIVMEQVEGQPLNSLAGAGGLSPDLVIRYGMQIADALAHAHKHGVIHRDLKSTNVLVTPEGRVKVLDFGLATRLRDTELQEAVSAKVPLTQSGMIVGTLPTLLRNCCARKLPMPGRTFGR